MKVALYADYIAELKGVFAELDQYPERFQVFRAHVELTAAGSLIVYETKRQKGQVDGLYYGRSAATGMRQQVSQGVAFAAIDRFFNLGQFVALIDQRDRGDEGSEEASNAVDAGYPHCAVNFSYRKKGQPHARSMFMVFVGFNDEADALHFVSENTHTMRFVEERPYRSIHTFEWK